MVAFPRNHFGSNDVCAVRKNARAFTPGASRGMSKTMLKGKRKGGYKSSPGASRGMSETMLKGRRKGG